VSTTTLSITEAADILGISRPTLVKMLDQGKLPYEQTNARRSLKLADVLAYKERQHARRAKALTQMTQEAVAYGLYDASDEDYAEALDQARATTGADSELFLPDTGTALTVDQIRELRIALQR
jgi:excisionase family DNA binding protein